MIARIVRGPILNPRPDGTVDFHADGALAIDDSGLSVYVGDWTALQPQLPQDTPLPETSRGVLMPPFLDAHIHIPQHSIRGRFVEGVPGDVDGGRLLAGLHRNVFPVEARAADADYARQVVSDFYADTLAQGVVGGAAYMTVHASAVQIALENLPETWQIGLVLMNQNCPQYLRTDEPAFAADVTALVEAYGERLILTDRFAVSVSTELRKRAAELANRYGLRMQTHLNEQLTEKALVEQTLYPDYTNYTDVYDRDGLLAHQAILAHCIYMSELEFQIVQQRDAAIAHCPTSNTLLGSGTMPLDRVKAHGIPYALCTDVGASPTTSMLCEMAQFLKVHAGRSPHATPQEALFRATLAPAHILGLDDELGSLETGKPASFIEVACEARVLRSGSADEVIRDGLLDSTPDTALAITGILDELAVNGISQEEALTALADDVNATARRLDKKVQRVTLRGRTVWERPLP